MELPISSTQCSFGALRESEMHKAALAVEFWKSEKEINDMLKLETKPLSQETLDLAKQFDCFVRNLIADSKG